MLLFLPSHTPSPSPSRFPSPTLSSRSLLSLGTHIRKLLGFDLSCLLGLHRCGRAHRRNALRLHHDRGHFGHSLGLDTFCEVPPFIAAQADDLIDFTHLKSRKGLSQVEIEDAVATDLKRATGFRTDSDAPEEKKLNRVVQLTGFSDPVYAEAYVTVHQYDIVMDVTVVNRTQ